MRYVLVLSLLIVARIASAEGRGEAGVCDGKTAAQLVSLQGGLLIAPAAGAGQWQAATLNQRICQGSKLKVEPYSRASLVLPSGIVLRLDEGTEVTLQGIEIEKPTLLNLLKGFIHFISRTPRQLQIYTPIANAGPEGTEFALRVDDTSAALWVYEGKVKFYNAQGNLKLKPGEAAHAAAGQAPQAKLDIQPKDAVNWALYYPPILPYPAPGLVIDNNLRTAIDRFRQGHGPEALGQMDKLSIGQQSPYFLKVRAAMRLTLGRVELAQQDIQTLLAANPKDADALAIKSVMALTQNRKDEAYQLAQQAVASNSQSATAYSALSYAEQGGFNLDKAQAAADQAAKLAPHDAMVWARKAELELSRGDTSDSQHAAKKAIELDDKLERTQTIQGFADLLNMDADDALKSFNKATELDSTAPLARLGLGLAKIRHGDLEDGRKDLEIAAILDPNNSIVRSYLGKAYYEERRPALADEQFKLARERDPKDPTPYFYDAINKQTTNRPVEALHDMQKAIEFNDNRAVYRSSLNLDKDAAARTTNIARIYNDLGFGRVALKEAWKSLGYDSTNPSAHRFLSDAYIGQPRYRVARASELLQAQLLQPINITPVQPQLTGENIGILNSTGPGSLSLNEYDPLYNANGAHVVLNGAFGSNNTKTDNAIVSGLYNNFSGSLGQFHYQTDGFRPNDEYKQDVYDAFAQYAITPDLNMQVELKSEDVRSGDVPLRLNGFHREELTKTIEQDTLRFGLHEKIDSEQDFIISSIYTTLKDIESKRKTGTLDFLGIPIPFKQFDLDEVTNKGTQTEVQYSYHPEYIKLITGFGYLNFDRHLRGFQEQRVFDFVKNDYGPPQTTPKHNDSTTEYINGYFYAQSNFLNQLNTTVGVSVDSYDDEIRKRNQINPKIGISWSYSDKLTIRGAVFRALKRPLATSQTIEPTQVAGFNQFFDSENGASAWQQGFGVDYQPVKNFYLGGQITFRETEFPLIFKGTPTFLDRNESSHLAYFYWTPHDYVSLAAEYHFDEFRRGHFETAGDSTDPKSVTTHQAPLSLSFYHPSGVFSRLTGTYVNQQVTTVEDKGPPSNMSEDFWTFDAGIGYRFPKKYGSISMEVRNLFDNDFNYQSTFDASGPQLSNFIPERQFFFKMNLIF